MRRRLFRTISTPEEFGEYIKSETAKWTKVIKAAGIKVDQEFLPLANRLRIDHIHRLAIAKRE